SPFAAPCTPTGAPPIQVFTRRAGEEGSVTNPYAPPQAMVVDIVDTHETNVAADRGTRLGAAMLDGIVGGAMIYLPLLIGGLFTSPRASGAGVAAPELMLLFGFAGFVAWSVLTYRYVKANGQTVGKKMLGIKVVRRDGSRASVARIFWLRNIVNGA